MLLLIFTSNMLKYILKTQHWVHMSATSNGGTGMDQMWIQCCAPSGHSLRLLPCYLCAEVKMLMVGRCFQYIYQYEIIHSVSYVHHSVYSTGEEHFTWQ